MSDATGIAAAVRDGSITATEVVARSIERCRTDPYNAVTAVLEHRALARSAEVDRMVEQGVDPGPLAGVPFAVKNLVDVAGVVTLAGSRMRRGDPPAARDATCIERLESAGAVLVATTNMDEFAYGFTTENSHYGATRNPLDPERIAGGSSGGAGAAVAGGLVPLSLGSDTNGSVRVPAALCGITGLRPSMGRIDDRGVVPFVRSLDTVGPLATSVRDLVTALAVLGGPVVAVGDEPSVAVLGGHFAEVGDPVVHEAVRRAAAVLGDLPTCELPDAARARSAAMVMTAAEGAEEHYEDIRDRHADFDPMTRDRFLAGTHVTALQYLAAARVQRAFMAETATLFAGVDVVLAPVTPCLATPIGQRRTVIGGSEQLVAPNLGIFTQPISFAHLPSVAVPVDVGAPLPAAVQVVAMRGRDEQALHVAGRIEAGLRA